MLNLNTLLRIKAWWEMFRFKRHMDFACPIYINSLVLFRRHRRRERPGWDSSSSTLAPQVSTRRWTWRVRSSWDLVSRRPRCSMHISMPSMGELSVSQLASTKGQLWTDPMFAAVRRDLWRQSWVWPAPTRRRTSSPSWTPWSSPTLSRISSGRLVWRAGSAGWGRSVRCTRGGTRQPRWRAWRRWSGWSSRCWTGNLRTMKLAVSDTTGLRRPRLGWRGRNVISSTQSVQI